MADSSCTPPWDTHVLAELIDELTAIRAPCVEIEHACEADLRDVHPLYRDSARNLLHYLALGRRDMRDVQKRLASLGLSSLGRTESHVLDNLTAVSRILHHLTRSAMRRTSRSRFRTHGWSRPAPCSSCGCTPNG